MYVEKGVVAIVVVAVIALLALLAWRDGEAHYQSCLANVDARYPVAYNPGKPGNKFSRTTQSPYFAFYPDKEHRDQAISDCSRLPF